MTNTPSTTVTTNWPAPIQTTADGMGATLTPDRMEVGRPYPYRLAGQWYVAVKDADGAVDVYEFRRSLLARLRRWFR